MSVFDNKAVTVICFNSDMSVIGYSIMDCFVPIYVIQRINTPLGILGDIVSADHTIFSTAN